MNGRELAPAGWAPHRDGRVRVLPAPDTPAPDGTWRVIDRAPDGWWVTPADAAARAWADDHQPAMLSRCLAGAAAGGVPGRRLAPAWLQLAVDP